MNRRHLLALAAVPALSFAVPAGAEAAPCVTALPGPGGSSWAIQADGSQQIATTFEGGTNFDAGHGRLTISGAPYPEIADDGCTTTATSITFPTRSFAGLNVTRRVESVGGRIRRLDTIVNATGFGKQVDVDFALRVLGSQRSIESESGDASVTSADHWSAHENSGSSFPFLQWGQDGAAAEPTVVSLGDEPAVWEQKSAIMPDATLDYDDIPIAAGTGVRLLHVNGTTGTRAESEAAAANGAGAFDGLTIGESAQVVNWGDDPDGDGVSRLFDECPSVAGNQSDGCLELVAQPAGGGGGGATTGQATAAVADPPSGRAATDAGRAGPARDTIAPLVRLTKLPGATRRSVLTRKGLAPRVACSEACSIQVTVRTRPRGRRTARTVLTTAATQRSTAPRTVRLRLKARHLRRLARRQVTLVVTATDAAGNRRSVARVVRLRR